MGTFLLPAITKMVMQREQIKISDRIETYKIMEKYIYQNKFVMKKSDSSYNQKTLNAINTIKADCDEFLQAIEHYNNKNIGELSKEFRLNAFKLKESGIYNESKGFNS
jgi:hypothetical protein